MTPTQIALTFLIAGCLGTARPRAAWIYFAMLGAAHLAFGWVPFDWVRS